MEKNAMASEKKYEAHLSRDLGLMSVTMIGAGIFVLTGMAAGAAGPACKLVRSTSIVDALVEESGRHSLTLIGASNQGVWEQLRLGSVPEMVSRRSSKSVVIVRKHEGPIKSWVRRFFAG